MDRKKVVMRQIEEDERDSSVSKTNQRTICSINA